MINLDVALLVILQNQQVYNKYNSLIDYEVIDRDVVRVLYAYKAWFKKFEKDVEFDEFTAWFFHSKNKELSKEKKEVYKLLFDAVLKLDKDSLVILDILKEFKKKELKSLIQDKLFDDIKITELKELVDKYSTELVDIADGEDKDVVPNDLDLILESNKPESGLDWRLECLQNSILPINKGAFIIVSAYVDVGKTAFAISEACYMARQIKGTGRVLWLNNEEDDQRVWKKIWKSVLGCSEAFLNQHKEKCKRKFIEVMNGDLNRIKLINIRKKSFFDIEKLFAIYKPELVIVDQIDKIVVRKRKDFSEHDRLKNLYGEFRGLANQYCPVIAISQADATTMYRDRDTGELRYQLYPHHRQLDASKVGKPGEGDAIIMIGRRNHSNTTRGIHVSKNKFGDIIKQEVMFDGEKCRYMNP